MLNPEDAVSEFEAGLERESQMEHAAEDQFEERDCQDDDLDESMDGDHESGLASVYGELDPPQDIDTPMADWFDGE